MPKVITGHEEEMAGLAEQAASPEYRAHCLKQAIAGRAEAQAILDAAEAGTLKPFETVFGEIEAVASQAEWAKRTIALYEQKITELSA